MLKKHLATCLAATALMAAPAFAQTTPPPSGTQMSKMDAAQFVDKAANSNMFEIQSSQAALQKTKNDRIHDFAQRMVTDHTQATDKMKAAAQGQTIPTSMDQEHTQMLQKLQQASGGDFDRTYVQMQVDGHQKAVGLFQSYSQNGDNAQLKQFAQQTLPTLQDHLQMITKIRDETSGSGAMAQNQGGQSSQQSGQQSVQYITQDKPGVWRASKLRGLNVYNDRNEKIGDINEVLVDREGKADAIVIGVGGFLGIGEHDVAVPFHSVQWSMTSRTANNNASGGSTAATTSANTGRSTTAAGGSTSTNNTGSSSGSAASSGGDNRSYPDHAILANATKDELKKAPQFKYNSR